MPRRKASTISVFFAPPQRKRLPFQGSWLGAAETERLLQICRDRLQAANSVCGLERKKRAQRIRDVACGGSLPPWSFLTRLRRPYLFSRKRKDRGEKSAWRRGVHSASEFRRTPMFRASFHTILTLRMSWYAPPDTGASDLIPVAVERLPSIEGAVKIQIICTFLRGVLGLYAPNGLPWGKLERRSRD